MSQLLFIILSFVTPMSPIVSTPLGNIQGIHRSTGDVYWGIPYAQPPVDNLLFRAPVPVTPWDTVLQATHGRENCVQEEGPFSSSHQSRDCLYLNVYVPEHQPSEQLPVVVWFHGGSWATGGTGAETDDGVRYDLGLFAQRVHAVVVTMNYRLNVFGFLYLQHLDNRYDSNCGLRDQLLALEWVHQNIACFGGDAQHITLMGQSAGAGSVLTIMSMPQINHLYERVILMSPPMDSYITRDEAIERTNLYLHMAPLDKLTDETICQTNIRFMKKLVLSGDNRCAFSPVIDGQLLSQYPRQGAMQCNKPMLIGYVSHETELFTPMIPKVVQWLFKNRLATLSEQMFFIPIDSFYAAYPGPKYKYIYRYTTPQMQEQGLHCCHSYEMPVIFGWKTSLCDPNDARTRAVGDSIGAKWSLFIHGKWDN